MLLKVASIWLNDSTCVKSEREVRALKMSIVPLSNTARNMVRPSSTLPRKHLSWDGLP